MVITLYLVEFGCVPTFYTIRTVLPRDLSIDRARSSLHTLGSVTNPVDNHSSAPCIQAHCAGLLDEVMKLRTRGSFEPMKLEARSNSEPHFTAPYSCTVATGPRSAPKTATSTILSRESGDGYRPGPKRLLRHLIFRPCRIQDGCMALTRSK